MPRVDRQGFVLPGENAIIDQAGWQCVAPDLEEIRGRCTRIATHVHRHRDGANRVQALALCPRHYEEAGAENA